MKTLVCISILLLLFYSSESITLEKYMDNLKGYTDISNSQKVDELTEFLGNYSTTEIKKKQILQTFKYDLEVISENDKLLKNNEVRKTILMICAETGKESFLEDKSLNAGERMEQLEDYIIGLNSYVNDLDVKESVLNYFNESFLWMDEHPKILSKNPHIYSFRKIYIPLEFELIMFGIDSKENKLEKSIMLKVYRKADDEEKKFIEILYKSSIDVFDNLFKESKNGAIFVILNKIAIEMERNNTQFKNAYQTYNKTLEILAENALNNQKKLRKFKEYAEGLTSRNEDMSDGKLKPEDIEHYTNFFNLTISMNETLEKVFSNSMLRKKVLSIFIAQSSTNSSEDYQFFDKNTPTFYRIASLPVVNENIYDGLSQNETEILKKYFELYIEWDYVFEGVINKPYEKFCDTYRYTETMQSHLKDEKIQSKYKIFSIRAIFRSKYWIDEEELNLITQWYEEKLIENQKIRESEMMLTEKIQQFIFDSSNSTNSTDENSMF